MRALALASCVVLCGCGRTITPSCEESPSDLGEDAEAPNGWSGDRVMALAGATRTVPGYDFDGAEMVVSILGERAAGVVEYVESVSVDVARPNGQLLGTYHPSIAVICTSYVRVPVRVTVVSDAPEVSFSAEVDARGSGDRVSVFQELDPSEMTGLPPSDLPGSPDAGYVRMDMIDPGAEFGSIGFSGSDENDDGSVTGWQTSVLSWEQL
jgi:hypothetical protein